MVAVVIPVAPHRALIPACAANALASSLEYERQSGDRDGDVINELSGILFQFITISKILY